MNPLNRRKLAAGALALTGLVHLVLAPEYLGEQAYVGVLFLAGAAASAVVAARLWWHEDQRAWLAGTALALGMGVGFVLSRTTGLPGFHEGEWELSGMVTLLLEAAFVGAALPSLRLPVMAGDTA